MKHYLGYLAPEPQRHLTVRTALIVEPDPSGAKLLAVVLQKAGFQTRVVGAGESAIEMLGAFKFHVVITELELPVMSGVMLIETLRATPAIQETPIVVVTSNHGAETKRQARAAGCSKFVAKPVEVTSFGQQILDLIGEQP